MLVIAMMGSVKFLQPIGPSARWACAGILFVFCALARGGNEVFRSGIVLSLVTYILWCALTVAWSLEPMLSALKVLALALIALAGLMSGFQWTINHRPEYVLDCMLPFVGCAIVAGGMVGQIDASDILALHMGGATNPNSLGSLLAVSIPVAIYKLHCNWRRDYVRLVWMAVLAACIIMLYRTASRASYLLAMGVVIGYFLGIGARRMVAVSVAVGLAILFVAVFVPNFGMDFVSRNIYKGTPRDAGIFYSREQVVEVSYEGARRGGVVGLGYGVSFDDAGFHVGATAVGYGREKGNSQLAIVEETGWIGLGLSTWLIISLIRSLSQGFNANGAQRLRVLMGLIIGTMVGQLLQGTFEAWWVSPGSQEFIIFWTFAGLGLGIVKIQRPQSGRAPGVTAAWRPRNMVVATAEQSGVARSGVVRRGER